MPPVHCTGSEVLKRGGRITATTAVLGSMLQIKPLLPPCGPGGQADRRGKARGRHASLKALVDRMEKTVTDEGGETVFISHGDCRGDADKVAEMVRERFGTRDVRINYVGPVIGRTPGRGRWPCSIWGRSAERLRLTLS